MDEYITAELMRPDFFRRQFDVCNTNVGENYINVYELAKILVRTGFQNVSNIFRPQFFRFVDIPTFAILFETLFEMENTLDLVKNIVENYRSILGIEAIYYKERNGFYCGFMYFAITNEEFLATARNVAVQDKYYVRFMTLKDEKIRSYLKLNECNIPSIQEDWKTVYRISLFD